jgi:hypothetical protein
MSMMEKNGITFFGLKQKYPDHPAFRDLQGISLGDVRFPFGFFVVEEKGKKIVIPGTRDDLTKRLLQAFPNYPVALIGISSGPCTKFQDACEGGCDHFPTTFECSQVWDDNNIFRACACVDWS